MDKTYEINNINQTESLAAELAGEIKKRRYVCLYGGLGAGKTTFTRYLVKAIIPECLRLVHSPTFAIVNEYLGNEYKIYHFDFYRIRDEDDLYSTGFYDYADRGGIMVVEWPDSFRDIFPPETLNITITSDGTKRIFKVEGNDI